jgi:branched-subunit amino acid ABC-type transport system permease component
MIFTIDVLRVAQVAIVALGAIVIYFALRGFAKRKSKAMLFLAIGFGFVTIGAVIAGILFEFIGADLSSVESVQAICQAIGFAIIVYSLTGTRN